MITSILGDLKRFWLALSSSILIDLLVFVDFSVGTERICVMEGLSVEKNGTVSPAELLTTFGIGA